MPCSKPLRLLTRFSERIISSAAKIDRSLVEVKGRAFVDRMKAELPRLPSNETTASPADTLVSELSEENIVTQCKPSKIPLISKLIELADEQWAGKVRFEYCDMTIAGANSVAYVHAWSEKIVEISHQVTGFQDGEYRYEALIQSGSASTLAGYRKGAGGLDD